MRKKALFLITLSCMLCYMGTPLAMAQQLNEASAKEKGTDLPSDDQQAKEKSFNRKGEDAEKSKWQLGFQLGVLFGKNQKSYYFPFMAPNILGAPSLQVSGGYRINQWLQPGVGIGLSHYGLLETYPIFAYIRGNITDRKVSPYYWIKAGKGPASLNSDSRYQEIKGGFMGEGQAGLEIRLYNVDLLFGAGYHLQKVEMKGNSPWGWQGRETTQTQKRNFNRLVISSTVKFSF